MLATIDVKLGAVNVTRTVRAQEINGSRHFFRLAQAALWNLRNYLLGSR
jgi:hypothetical protein